MHKSKEACVFAGPSLSGQALPADITIFPPATRGAVTAAITSGYRRIGFIDGAVEENERLPLRELREALAIPGITLFGAASMGAVRAAQLTSAGMRGVGRVFRLFRRRQLTDADEVYVLYAPAGLRYRSLTLPLVNIRYTARAMRRAGYVNRAEEQALVSYACTVPWFDRDRASLSAGIYEACGSLRCRRVTHAFEQLYRDVKREDALSVVTALTAQSRPAHARRRVA